jgi:hypothetical protein
MFDEPRIGGTLDQELARTAEMLVEGLPQKERMFYSVALLLDSGYDLPRLKALLPYLWRLEHKE